MEQLNGGLVPTTHQTEIHITPGEDIGRARFSITGRYDKISSFGRGSGRLLSPFSICTYPCLQSLMDSHRALRLFLALVGLSSCHLMAAAPHNPFSILFSRLLTVHSTPATNRL